MMTNIGVVQIYRVINYTLELLLTYW